MGQRKKRTHVGRYIRKPQPDFRFELSSCYRERRALITEWSRKENLL